MTGDPALFDLRGTGSADLASVRRWAARRLSDLGEPHREDVLLVLNEIVQNAYEHAGGAHRLRLTRSANPCEVTIGVEDSSLLPPRLREVAGTGFGGRGLYLVDKLATAWGSRDDLPVAGKTVWAKVSCGLAHQEPCR
ncbi:ATP-binding protein [Amycolatopsis sp. NPDC048633]|uniref:ATP-binding protein n=1 Tax=Amycolatopsis sp. NPDC048633 TaxID=3157095 RepID=UPI0033EAAD04